MANASKVEFVVAQAKEALESGMSVVVGLQSTGESGMDKVGSVERMLRRLQKLSIDLIGGWRTHPGV